MKNKERYQRAKAATTHWHEGAARTLMVLEKLLREGSCNSITELSKAINLPHTTCYRIMQTLSALKWIDQDRIEGTYDISSKLYGRMNRFSTWREIHVKSLPLITTLAESLQFPCKLSVWNAGQIMCLASVMPNNGQAPNNHKSGHSGIHTGVTTHCILKDYNDEALQRTFNIWSISKAWQNRTWPAFQAARTEGISIFIDQPDSYSNGIAVALQTYFNEHPLVLTAVIGERPVADRELLLEKLKHGRDQLDALFS